MHHREHPSGYILLLTLMIIAISVVLVTYIANKGTIFVPFARTIIEREKAKMLAVGGIQLAISQLLHIEKAEAKKAQEPAKDAKQEAGEKNEGEEAQQLLKNILPTINRWQIVELKQEVDGLDGEISICISCEEGKIDINQLYDFEKHKFINEGQPTGDRKQATKELFTRIQKLVGGERMFEAFEKFLKERHYKLNDVTELLTLKEFEVFKQHIFYEPPMPGDKGKKEKRPLYLTDIFTVWSDKQTIEPWLMADSLNGVLDLSRAQPDDTQERERMADEWLKKFKIDAKWQNDWNTILAPLYKKDFASLPKVIASMLSTKFEPIIFSVLSYAKIGAVTQRIFAVIEKYELPQNNDSSSEIRIKKVYWL